VLSPHFWGILSNKCDNCTRLAMLKVNSKSPGSKKVLDLFGEVHNGLNQSGCCGRGNRNSKIVRPNNKHGVQLQPLKYLTQLRMLLQPMA
jgi:hypothetical protein